MINHIQRIINKITNWFLSRNHGGQKTMGYISKVLRVLFFYLFFYWRILYRIVLFSVKPQHESAIGIPMSPPSWTSFPSPSPSHPSRLITGPCLSFLKHNSKFPLAVYFTCGNVIFHVTLSTHLTLSSPLPMSISLLSVSVSVPLPCR